MKIFNQTNRLECAVCPGKKIETKNEVETFLYGEGKGAVELIANIPVRKCLDCGMEFTDHEAEVLRHEAVCNHLRRLTPKEIRALRGIYAQSRKQFSDITLIGEASLARWETGELIQTGANDQLLYLLQFRENFNRLLSRRPNEPNLKENFLKNSPTKISGKFKALNKREEDQLIKESKNFKLQSVA